jgi:hypothetical protein
MRRFGFWLSTAWLSVLLMSPIAYIAPKGEEADAEGETEHLTTDLYKKYTFISSQKNRGCSQCPELFDDSVRRHARSYRWDGIKPKESFEDFEKLEKVGVLSEIETNRLFEVETLTYSAPYLLPVAEKFLVALGKRYEEKCAAAGLEYVPFVITSVTRTTKSVKKLRRGNRNAIENSAHLRGKTVDVSYRKFEDNQKQLNLFVDALYELKQEGWCFVKYERTGCLHITAR